MSIFNNKVVVITGAGSGIGQELAMQFAAKGAILALNDWKEEALNETWEIIPDSARGHKTAFDVGSREAVENFASQVRKA
ncbi:MAG: SDR family NAD(P)-dependent oxidoreductase, partial [Bacteroidota bacterium]